MHQFSKTWITYGLVIAVLLCTGANAHARYGSGSSQFRRYMQNQQKAQMQVMQMQQKAMMEAMARQAAIEKQKRDNLVKARKDRSDKEEQHRQEMIAKRKAEQATTGSEKK